jgi:hypothetical protein
MAWSIKRILDMVDDHVWPLKLLSDSGQIVDRHCDIVVVAERIFDSKDKSVFATLAVLHPSWLERKPQARAKFIYKELKYHYINVELTVLVCRQLSGLRRRELAERGVLRESHSWVKLRCPYNDKGPSKHQSQR